MAGKRTGESFGNRNLWQFISGVTTRHPKEKIKEELTRNKEKLLKGLLYYKKPLVPLGELLKSKTLPPEQIEFVKKLSIFLCLDEDQSYDLYLTYMRVDFRGSQKNIALSVSTERHSLAFMLKIRDFYYSERLYLLHCIQHVLAFWSDGNHPYREEYRDFMRDLDDKQLQKNLLQQLEQICDDNLPNWDTQGTLMNQRQTLVWAQQNLKEQRELLVIMLVHWKEVVVSAMDFTKLLERFKRQGFGRRQTYKHVLDDSMEMLLKCIGCLEVLVLLQAMDLETAERLSHNETAERLSHKCLLKDQDTFQSVDNTIKLLGSEQPHGPILLSWAIICQFYLDGDGAMKATRKYGNKALQLNVFEFLSELLEREPFSGKSMTASHAHCVIHSLLLACHTAFDESTLTRNSQELQILYNITSKLMERDIIANIVWQKGLDYGIGNMFKTALLNFPLDFSTFVKLSTSLASANTKSASRVLELWSELPQYTEYLDRNSSVDIQPTADSKVWQLVKDKTPYSAEMDFRIPAGVYGQLISSGHQPAMDANMPIVQWEVSYDGWQLLKGEIRELLHQIAKGSGMVASAQVVRVTEITQFVHAICNSEPSATEGLSDIVSLLYSVIHRFSSISTPPLELLAASVDCVTCMAKIYPKETWHNMKQTWLLPFQTENCTSIDEVLSGRGWSQGLYGSILAGFEVPQGHYPVTVAFLNLIAQLIEPLMTLGLESELQPSVVYILREIFPFFQKWRYYNILRKEVIGVKCLQIAHVILNFKQKNNTRPAPGLNIQELCKYSLLCTEAGRALLEIVGTGVETVEMVLAQQSSLEEGSGDDLLQMIQSGFSVLNRLLQLRATSEKMSPVEVALSSQPAGYQNQHIVAVIAEYIYHRSNPQLPKLSTLFLRRLAVVLPMSILACLGSQGEPIRDIYLMRLQNSTEDLSLKTGILELLSVCVDTQPGLTELFLNVQSSQPSDTDKGTLSIASVSLFPITVICSSFQRIICQGMSNDRTSCIQTVLGLMDQKRQGTYKCPANVLCACINFIQALWAGMRETAMAAFRAEPNFWPSLCKPLFQDLQDTKDNIQSCKLKTVSYILRILAQEIYSLSSKLDENLKKMLKELADKGRIKCWSAYITDCVKMADNGSYDSSPGGTFDSLDHPVHKLLLAWKNFLVVVAKINVPELKLNSGLQELLIVDLLECVHAQLQQTSTSELHHKLVQTCSALFFTLVKNWKSSLKVWQQVFDKSHEALTFTITGGDFIPSVQIGICGAITAILQYHRLDRCKKTERKLPKSLEETDRRSPKGLEDIIVQKLRSVLISSCEMLVQNTRRLPSPHELRKVRDTQDTLERSLMYTDHRLKLQMLSCSMIDELIHNIGNWEIWLPVLQENMILPTLLSSAEVFLKSQEGLHYMQALFILLLTIAKDDKGAEALCMAGLTQHVCVSVTFCYMNGGESGYISQKHAPSKTKRTTLQITWHSIYYLCLELYTTMLSTLKYSFLEDAFNFIGSHQDRLQQCLEVVRFSLYPDIFKEVAKTCLFVCQLTNFGREWRLNLPETLNKILLSMLYMCQMFVSHLIQPRYLQYILEHGAERMHKIPGASSVPTTVVQHHSSMEDLDNPSQEYLQVQESMIQILGECFVALRHFSPDLVQILMDPNMDIGEYQPFLAVGFSTPLADQDTLPTFGTMLSCVGICLRILSKVDVSKSPQKADQVTGPLQSSVVPDLSRTLMFVIENALYLTMSQGMLYLRDPAGLQREKQLLKRELGTEINSILSGVNRYIRRGGPHSPAGGSQLSPRSQPQPPVQPALSRSVSQTFLTNKDHAIFRLVQEFSKQVLR